MKRAELIFDRPDHRAATQSAEARGVERDSGRLLVSTPDGHTHAHFRDLPAFLRAGDLLIVNDSATLPASLPAHGGIGDFIVNAATDYGGGVWLVEPRWSASQPGPMPFKVGDRIIIGADETALTARLIAPFPELRRLWFISVDGDLRAIMAANGLPIRYGYIAEPQPLATYQTVFAAKPGSAEMPSAAYPFTPRLVSQLRDMDVQIAPITLHTGVSSLEVEVETVEHHPLYPEPYSVPASTARMVNAAHAEGRRVIAIGTTVVRALESAWYNGMVQPSAGFTRLYVHPGRGVHSVDGLLTGLHDPVTSHLAMLYAVGGQSLIREGYAEAVRQGYHWHEFGDSQLILSERSGDSPGALRRMAD